MLQPSFSYDRLLDSKREFLLFPKATTQILQEYKTFPDYSPDVRVNECEPRNYKRSMIATLQSIFYITCNLTKLYLYPWFYV
jgi:hypothetical protein